MLLDRFVDHLGIEAHGSNVERVAMYQFFRIGFHQLYASIQRIRHIHHIHKRAGLHRAHKVFAPDSIVENFHSVVRCSSTGRRHVRDQTRKAHRTSVHCPTFVVVVAQQFACHLGDAIDGGWALNGVLWSFVFGCVFAKSSDGTRGEETASKLFADLQAIDQAVDAYIPTQFWVLLCHHR